MNLEKIVVMIVGLFGVVLLILGLAGTMGAEWTTVSEHVTTIIAMLCIFGVVVGAIVHYSR